jgi:diacylglycerol O-acyltransferase
MSPTSSVFLLLESREHPMHVGGLQLFEPPAGASALDVRELFLEAVRGGQVAPLFGKRARRSLTSLGQWGWEPDTDFDIDHHVRFNALPQPGRVLELLALCSRLHSTLLDRHRPLWEVHLIEGLADGRYAVYLKAHHALVDGVNALRVMSRTLSGDPGRRDMPAPWAVPTDAAARGAPELGRLPVTLAHGFGELIGAAPAALQMLNRALSGRDEVLGVAPRTPLNVPITGARRFAAQSWPMARTRAIARAGGVTLNDVVLAMCSGALRRYLLDLHALPDRPLIAMVPVSLHRRANAGGDGGGNAVGAVLCDLGTTIADPAQRLRIVHASMLRGKHSMAGLTQLQALAISALALSPVALAQLLRTHGHARPPFNLIISNVPGPRRQLYWNGARLAGLYPLSVPIDGQALNITCTSYSDQLAFGLTGCRRTVPHLQRLLSHLDAELAALEDAVLG